MAETELPLHYQCIIWENTNSEEFVQLTELNHLQLPVPNSEQETGRLGKKLASGFSFFFFEHHSRVPQRVMHLYISSNKSMSCTYLYRILLFTSLSVFKVTRWYLENILWLKETAEQKPKASAYMFQSHYSFYVSKHQAPADMLIQQTVTTLTVQTPSKANSWAALVSEYSWKRQKSWTKGEMQKH